MRILLDNEGYVSQWTEKDDVGCMSDNDIIITTPKDFDFSAFREDFRYYKVVDGVLVKDENRVLPEREKTTQEQIAELKAQLSATDYKVIKCSECQLLGMDMPYDVAELHAERQAIRDQINQLERGNTYTEEE